MNGRIVLGGLSIIAALAMMGGATFAAFSASNTNSGNTFAAGTMTLQINTQTPTSTGVFAVTGGTPGSSTDKKLTLKNGGTMAATSVKIAGIAVTGTANFGDHLTLQFFNDANDNGVLDGGETILGTGHLTDPVWASFTLPGVTLPAGGTYNLGARLTLDLDTDNLFQGANAGFDITIQAAQ